MDLSFIEHNVEELQTLYSTLFLLVEESLVYDELTSENLILETKRKTEAITDLIQRKSTEFYETLEVLKNNSDPRLDHLRQKVQVFSRDLSLGLKGSLRRIDRRSNFLEEKQKELRTSIEEVKEAREKYKGYKGYTEKKPRLFNSSV